MNQIIYKWYVNLATYRKHNKKELMTEQTNEFKGFSLFNDIKEDTLRIRNRAVVLANIAEDNSQKGLISMKGASLIFGYFKLIPPHEQYTVQNKFEEMMKERGFKEVK